MKRTIAFLFMLLIGVIYAPAQIRLPGMGRDSKEERERKQKEKEQKDTARNESRYLKLKNYSVNKYQADIDFRDDVDEAFEDLLREHSRRAYDKNVERGSYMRTVHEDNWREHVQLYDNLRVQDYINRIGQKLVPEGSEKLYAFKVVPDPIPSAETLSTGTIYLSTGLISMLDNEAQLAYVLAHEMAHVHLDHWKERVMMEIGQEEYAKDQAKKAARWALLGTVAGAAIGGATRQSASGAVGGALIGAGAGFLAGSLLNRPLIVNWDRVEEDAADDLAFKAVLSANFDVREVPNLYIAMEKMTAKDSRATLGFLGNRRRITQRREKATDLISNAMKADIDARLQKGFTAFAAEGRNILAELKRDNGISAYYHDMFEMARTNLADAAAIRDNDPAVHYFYGKVLKLVGRTDEERKIAAQAFTKASQHDYRQQNYGSHIHQALLMLEEQSEKKASLDPKVFTQELDEYVTNYAKWNLEHLQMRMFPPNMDSIYEYMRLYGDKGWRPKPPKIEDVLNYSRYYSVFGDIQTPEIRKDAQTQNASFGSESNNPEPGRATNPAAAVGTAILCGKAGMAPCAAAAAATQVGNRTTAPKKAVTAPKR